MPGRTSCLLLAAGLLLLICCAGCRRTGDVPAARVNDVIISQSELRRFINLMELCNPGAGSLHKKSRLKRNEQEFLHLLIGFELVDQAAAAAGVVVDQAAVEIKTGEMLQTLVETGYDGSYAEFHRQCKVLRLGPGDLTFFARYHLQEGALFEHVGSTVKETDLLFFIEDNPGMFMQPAAAEVHRFRFNNEQEAGDCLARLERGAAVEEIAAAGTAGWSNLGWFTGDDPFLAKEVREQLFPASEAGKSLITLTAEKYYLYWIQRVRPAEQPDFDDVKEEALQLKKCLCYEQFCHALWDEGGIEIYEH